MRKIIIFALLLVSSSLYSQLDLKQKSDEVLNEGLELYQMMLALEKSNKDLGGIRNKDWNIFNVAIYKEKETITIVYVSKDGKRFLTNCFREKKLDKYKRKVKKKEKLKNNLKKIRRIFVDINESYLTEEGYIETGELENFATFIIKKENSYKGFRIFSSIKKEVFRFGQFREYVYDEKGVRENMILVGCNASELNQENWSSTDLIHNHWHYNKSYKFISSPEIAKALFKCENFQDEFQVEVFSFDYVSIFFPKKKELIIMTTEEYEKDK